MFPIYCHLFIIEWFASQTKFKTVIEEMEKEELNECLTMFYAAVRREDGTEFKVSSLKAIRAAIDRYLRQPPNNKPWSIVGDSAFQKSNKVLNAICKQMMQDGKVGNNYNSFTKQGNSASGIPWIRLNSSALHGFTSPFISVKGGVKIRESSPQTCWFFGLHLKGDVSMSFAATLHPKIIKEV